jgi:hypothetical protein
MAGDLMTDPDHYYYEDELRAEIAEWDEFEDNLAALRGVTILNALFWWLFDWLERIGKRDRAELQEDLDRYTGKI